MATSAFKSTSRRTSIGGADDSSLNNLKSSAHRRSRSLSRFTRRLPTQPSVDDFDGVPAPTAKFVNTVRGSGFPEISLDDLAIELFDSGNRGRLASRNFESSSASGSGEISQNQRRGRSVSRQTSRASVDGRGSVFNSSGRGRVVPEANSRRRRSVSVVRYQISDSESDLDHSLNYGSHDNLKRPSSGNKQASSFNKQAATNHRPMLRRSMSQKDLKPYDGYSSQSSVITDDEGRDAYPKKSGTGRAERAVYAHKKVEHPAGIEEENGLYEAMRKELLRHAVNDIKLEIEQAVVKTKNSSLENAESMLSNNSDVMNAVSSIRRNYATKLEKSEKRKQDLLAEIVLEEQRGRELCKIVKELLPDTNSNCSETLSHLRKGRNDRNKMSERLSEEAEKYIEDFISNVEDTDISSLDGERSDTSSSIGGIMKQEAFHSPAMSRSLPVEMDGVILPWLKWETSNDASPMTRLNKTELPITPTNADATQDMIKAEERSNHSVSSHGSWSPGVIDSLQIIHRKDLKSKLGEFCSYQSKPHALESEGFHPHEDDYLKRQNTEDFLVERLQQRHRISSGSLLLCQQMLFNHFPFL